MGEPECLPADDKRRLISALYDQVLAHKGKAMRFGQIDKGQAKKLLASRGKDNQVCAADWEEAWRDLWQREGIGVCRTSFDARKIVYKYVLPQTNKGKDGNSMDGQPTPLQKRSYTKSERNAAAKHLRALVEQHGRYSADGVYTHLCNFLGFEFPLAALAWITKGAGVTKVQLGAWGHKEPYYVLKPKEAPTKPKDISEGDLKVKSLPPNQPVKSSHKISFEGQVRITLPGGITVNSPDGVVIELLLLFIVLVFGMALL